MSRKTDFKLDWCSHEAAEYAVEHWHYSKTMPAGKLVHIGVWEDAKFVGAIVFGRGANNRIGSAYGLPQTEICELVRVALREHRTPVSRLGAIALRMLRKLCPGVRLIVSYADPQEGHHGGVYQAMGWLYVGSSRPQRELLIAGKFTHKRSAFARWGTASVPALRAKGIDADYAPVLWKHTYLLPLDDEMRAQIAPLAKPYPKRAGSADSGTPGNHPGGGGANPTSALDEVS